MLLFIQFTQDIFNSDYRFNTSHVTLYPAPHFPLALCTPCFNTSHVTLYLQLLQTCIQTKKCFNTSHVTLYHKRSFNFFLHNGVSIHLMLLFIRRRSSENAQLFRVSIHLMLLFISKTYRRSLFPNLFQYISCYSLSSPSPILLFRYSSFNTSHVTLYLSPVCRLFIPDVVSIHLMLLFILWQEL